MKENPIKISRGNSIKLVGLTVLGLAGLASGGYLTYQYAAQEGLIPHSIDTALVPTDLLKKLQKIEASKTATPFSPGATSTSTMAKDTEAFTPTPELGDLFAGKIDLFDFKKSIRGLFTLNDGHQLLISPFNPLENSADINAHTDFAPGKGIGLTWKNYRQYEGINKVDYFLWLHSGRMIGGQSLEMTDLQEFLDFVQDGPQRGYRRNYPETYEILKNTIIGSSLLLDQEKNGSALGKIEAAIRIPPQEVILFYDQFKQDPSKILEYLGQKYPGYGFENILRKNKNLVLVTCGTNLNGGEKSDPGRKSYEQSRYIFVITA